MKRQPREERGGLRAHTQATRARDPYTHKTKKKDRQKERKREREKSLQRPGESEASFSFADFQQREAQTRRKARGLPRHDVWSGSGAKWPAD